eukprot:CAMPEP_0181101562 /NCGR_PEP_ID=MMETSP1071-20121207/13826_1 /TAXON_ID=35127 /ORGANISM="Thalassiosira sp., Strain NH16" /LENGTH=866 /DNA_ID=CAMNT_0023184433 /DNA_START=246 /DNA_END=2846 /DNA_ORIENTATION=+
MSSAELGGIAHNSRRRRRHHHHFSSAPLLLFSSRSPHADAIAHEKAHDTASTGGSTNHDDGDDDGSSSGDDATTRQGGLVEARRLQERANILRIEASNAERTLRDERRRRKDEEIRVADGYIDLLLTGRRDSSRGGGSSDVQTVANEGTGTTSQLASSDGKGTGGSVPSARTLSLRITDNDLGTMVKLRMVVDRLHERETAMMTGPEGLLSRTESIIDDYGVGGGGGGGSFVLGDEGNSMERRQEESDRISGLLDGILEAVELLDDDDDKEGRSVASDRAGDINVRSSANNMASKLRVRVADLRQSRDALVKRRVDNLANNVRTKKNSSMMQRTNNNDEKSTTIDDYIFGSIDNGDANDDSSIHDGDDEEEKRRRIEGTKMMKRILESPPWLPPSLASFAATSPVEVPVSIWKMFRTDVLASTDFACTSWDGTDVAAVFRGRLPRRRRMASETGNTVSSSRSSDEVEDERSTTGDHHGEQQQRPIVTDVFANMQRRLEEHVELKDRIRIFLVDDYEWRPSFDTTAGGSGSAYGKSLGGWTDDDDDDGPPPVIIALAREVEPLQSESERSIGTKVLAASSACLAVLTTFAYAVGAFALNPTIFDAVVRENDVRTIVPACMPIFFGVLAIAALHEVGHAVAARARGVRLGWPVILPSLQVGTFGSITPLRSFPLTRSDLFDVAVCGPGVSMMASLILIVSGLGLTVGSESLATFPVVPAAIMKSSFLIGTITSVMAPGMMMAPLPQPIPIHPFFFVGLAGLMMNAVNLLPIGRLDGGRAFTAVWGRRPARLVSFLSLIATALYSLSSQSGGIAIFFGALIILTGQREPDIACVDEVTGVGGARANGYIALLALALLTLAPFPGGTGPI